MSNKVAALASGIPVMELIHGVPVVGTDHTGVNILRGLYVGDDFVSEDGPTCMVIVAKYGMTLNASVRMVNPKVDLTAKLGFLYALEVLAYRRGLDPRGGIILTRVGVVGRKKADWVIEDRNGGTEGVLTKTPITNTEVVLATALRESYAND